MALVVLEPIRSEDEVIIEARKEERHEHIRSRKLAIFEYAHLHQGPLRRLGFEVVLPEAECDDDNEGNDDENGDPWSAPAHDVAFGEGKNEHDEPDGEPVDRVAHDGLLFFFERGRNRNDKVTCNGGDASYDTK